MAWFGIGGSRRIQAPTTIKAPAPKPQKGVPTTPLAPLDQNGARGLGAYRAGVKVAQTQPLAPLPWTGWGAWLDRAKMNFVETYTQTFKARTQDFIAKHDLGPNGSALLNKMADDGKFAKMDRKMNTLMDQVDKYLEGGGRKDVAMAVLKQIDNPDSIIQAQENTCAAATLQKGLAVGNPARYFRLMTELAGKGKADIGDVELLLSKESRKDIKGADMSLNERMSAYFQAAMMERANGDATYDFSADKSKLDKKGTRNDTQFTGVGFEEARDINQLLMEAPTVGPERLKAYIEARKEQGQSRAQAVKHYMKERLEKAEETKSAGVFIAIEARGHKKGHMVLVRGMDDEGNFRITDANGKEKVWSPEKLAQRAMLDKDKAVGDLTVMEATTTSTTTGPRRR